MAQKTTQIGQLAERIGVELRTLRFVIERGHVDRWVKHERSPGKGNHRQLSRGAAFAVALMAKLKLCGLKTPKAQRVVEIAHEGIRMLTQSLGWEHSFDPFRGNLKTDFKWTLEIGDGEAIQLATNANPSLGGKMETFPWISIDGKRRNLPDFTPIVTITIELSALAALVDGDDR